MSKAGNPNEKLEWSLYADPSLFRVRVEPSAGDEIALTFETEDEAELATGLSRASLGHEDGQDQIQELCKATLHLRIEELPRLVAILNEIYRQSHDRGTWFPAYDEQTPNEWGPRRVRSGHMTETFPLGSRLEPESVRDDWEDRIATLRAYKVVADRLSADLVGLGILRPIA